MTRSLRTALPSLASLRLALRNNALDAAATAALQHDSRAGARALWRGLQALKQARRDEEARLDVMLRHELALWAQGSTQVGGLDEVGVGPLLGPVVAVVVVLPQGARIQGVNDSKKLSAATRAALAETIQQLALGVGIGLCSALEIDAMNIFAATREAMRRAVMNLPCALDHLLVDAHRVPGLAVPQTALIGGDQQSHAIAAASIVAKVTRDTMMVDYDAAYPGYGLLQHKGYGTDQHLQALARLGPTPEHRQSFAPVRAAALRHGRPTFEAPRSAQQFASLAHGPAQA